MSIRIIAIKKDNGNHRNPYEAITHFQWLCPSTGGSGVSTRAEMVKFLEGGGAAFVERDGQLANCGVRNNGRIKYVQTYSDGYYDNNLLSLPEF